MYLLSNTQTTIRQQSSSVDCIFKGMTKCCFVTENTPKVLRTHINQCGSCSQYKHMYRYAHAHTYTYLHILMHTTNGVDWFLILNSGHNPSLADATSQTRNSTTISISNNVMSADKLQICSLMKLLIMSETYAEGQLSNCRCTIDFDWWVCNKKIICDTPWCQQKKIIRDLRFVNSSGLIMHWKTCFFFL